MPSTVTLALTRSELGALAVGLHEYLYMVEEGTPQDVLDEIEWSADHFELTADGAAGLLDRVMDALKDTRVGERKQGRGTDLRESLELDLPTYNGHLFSAEIDAGRVEEYGNPIVPALVYREAGIRIVLGTHDAEDMNKPDIKVERQPNGWGIFLHPDGGDPSGYVYFRDDGRTFVVPENGVGPTPPIQVLKAGEPVRGFHRRYG